jgi:Icc-related predicted phosphoesterase
MKILVLADIDEFGWTGGGGRADALLALGDISAVFAVKGNHDGDAPFPAPVVDLHLRTHELGGLSFGGLNGCLQYKPRGHFLYYQEEVEAFLADFPAVDVFISHNSPRGVHDRDDDVHTGFSALNTYIDRAAPRLLLHGHQHVDRETQVGQTRVIGIYGWKTIEL